MTLFRLFRVYSIASLACILGTAIVMALLYRNIAVQGLVRLAENNNLAMAEIALDPIRPALADYLIAAAQRGKPRELAALPPQIDDAIVELMRNPRVKRIKIYGQSGTVLFSTKTSQIGGAQEDNEGFVTAINGRPAVELVYRDTFNVFDDETEEDNLVQSYIPVRRKPTEPVVGVFEVYTDVNELVADTERTEIRIVFFTVAILSVLYAVLLMIVRKARNIIDAQQQTIREKTAVLEQLSRSNLAREELDRKKAAEDLHEGLAQTLSAIKLAVENAQESNGTRSGTLGSLKPVVPALQSAIGQVRAIAMDLRPPSLDELGLVATIRTACREVVDAHPSLRVEASVEIDESRIPAQLHAVVYRNIEAALKLVVERSAVQQVRITLRVEGEDLVLDVEADGKVVVPPAFGARAPVEPQSPLAAVRERTILSGGELTVTHDDAGGLAFRASWLLTGASSAERRSR